jgi:DNA helicase II / ATP-dependent DNA helicase PcrA
MAVSKGASSSKFQPDPQQRAAIEHVTGPMLVLAGAGTGKTTVLIRRIANLIREGHARPDEILALTYTNNAANEMRERIEGELRGFDIKDLQVGTFHAYCNELLKRSERDFSVLDDQQLWIFLRRNIRELRLNYYVRAASIGEFLKDLLEFMRRCQDELVGPAQYRAYVERIDRGELPVPRVGKSKKAKEITDEESRGRCHEIAFVFDTVERMLSAHNFGTFGHMILRAHELLSEDPVLLEGEQDRAKFILVDEFQDANFAQIKTLETLAGSAQNIFAVGDPDQGIYRFRGASSGAFELFQRQFASSKLAVLNRNRRSTTPILKCAHALIAENPEFSLSAEAAAYHRNPLISARDQEDPARAAKRLPLQTVLVSGNFMEATDLVSTLIERRRQSRCEWKNIAVLYRTHFHRDEVAAELARNGIPFSIEGLDVLDTPEVRDLLACLGAVVSDADSAAFFRAAALPQFSVDPDELRNAIKSLPRDATATMLSVLSRVKGGEALLQAVRQSRQESASNKVYATLLSLIRIFRISRGQAVDALLRFSNQWETSPLTKTGEPGEFLEYLDYFREARGTIPLPAAEEENAVKLMTAHSAKGLEFDHVFILRATKGSFPTYYREPLIEIPAELRNSGLADSDEKKVCEQEERRLFYVAMTRARDTLTIYGQFGKGQLDKTPPGFVRELLKNRELKGWLAQRTCREFQTDIFAAAQTPSSRLEEWINLAPASDLAATLSASSIQHYETCPLQFKLDREWRIPAEASAALQYGACVHRVLLTYYDSIRWERTLGEPELIDLFRTELASAGFSDHYQRELYEQKGITELRAFVAASAQIKPDVLHTEERFSVKIGPTTLVGRIDRIDRARASADSVVITDYKTGRPRSQEDADESLQLSLYALAAREKWGYRSECLVFHNLEGNSSISSQRTDVQLQEAQLHVEDIAAKISAGNFEPKPGFHCAWCAYRSLCPKTEKRIPELLAVSVTGQN